MPDIIGTNYDMLSMKSIEKQINNRTFTDYYYRLMLLAKSVFKWNNLPNGIDEKWIEKYLFAEGRCMFFKDPEKGLMVSKCVDAGRLNFYDEPTMLSSVATNYNRNGKKWRNTTECILVRNNDDMIPTAPTIQLYAYRLAELTRTIDINVAAMKTPVFIKCSEKQKLTLSNMYKQWDGFLPLIFADKNLDLDNLAVLKTDAPIVFPQLQLQKHAIWNECMTFLGINNANQDKRERLVADEVGANDDQIKQSADVMLKSRQLACKSINELYGTNITVERRNLENSTTEDTEERDIND